MGDIWRSISLFGGATEIALPQRFVDVSDFRPVPDNQEVYTDAALDQSFIVEIVERLSLPDAKAVQACFDDLAQFSSARMHHLESESVLSPQDVPGVPAETYKAVAVGEQMLSKGRQGSEAANRVQVMMAIIRLQQEASEVLITLNTPMHVSEHSAAAAAVQPGPKADHKAATALFRQALASFKIRDYGLFG